MASINKIGRPVIDLTGKTFGRLTVMHLVDSRPKRRRWKCQCACGKSCDVDQGKLREGSIKSCGCLAHDNAIKQSKLLTLPHGTAFLNMLFSTYKVSASKTNRNFVLTRSEFENLILKRCYYCGAEPKQPEWALRTKRLKIHWFNGIPCVNGLDRKNSTQGYTKDNTVPCCKTCNIAKHTMSVDEFITWARQVTAHTTFYLK